MSRNSNSIVTSVPTNRKPRSTIDFGIVSHLSSAQHGRLYPNFIKPVFPGDTFNMKDFAGFAYADKSQKLPLQDIIYDQYFFFVPFRVIDRHNWDKVLGYRENPLDHSIYSVPQIDIQMNFGTSTFNSLTNDEKSKLWTHLIFSYLGYNLPDSNSSAYHVSGSAYPLMAYWTIWNEFFRSEVLDNALDINTLLAPIRVGSGTGYLGSLTDSASGLAGIMAAFEAHGIIPQRVNKLHDPLTTGMLTPQRSPDGQAVPIYLAGLAPVIAQDDSATPSVLAPGGTFASVKSATTPQGHVYGNITSDPSDYNFYADLSQASAIDINQLRLAFAIQSLYEAKGRFGSRYISYIAGIWGVHVPDSALDRPEYLGGIRLDFNNMPVLNTANNLGLFSGYSATLFKGCQFDKTFLEYGYVIGLHCERVRHTYPQGIDLDVWDKKVELDFYNPKFAELGFMGYKKSLIFGDNIVSSIFNYNEAWTYERAQLSRASGIFGSLGGTYYQEFREKWCYSDWYSSSPTFNSDWLKESATNVARTMTGELIVGAPDAVAGHQYMFEFKFHYTITRIIPVYSTPAELGGRW